MCTWISFTGSSRQVNVVTIAISLLAIENKPLAFSRALLSMRGIIFHTFLQPRPTGVALFKHSQWRRTVDEAIMCSHALSRARRTQNNCMPQLICGRLTLLSASRALKSPLGRKVGPRNFRHGGQRKRDVVLFLGAIWSRNTHRSILRPAFYRKKLERRAAQTCSLKHAQEASQPDSKPQEVLPLLVYVYLGMPRIKTVYKTSFQWLRDTVQEANKLRIYTVQKDTTTTTVSSRFYLYVVLQ